MNIFYVANKKMYERLCLFPELSLSGRGVIDNQDPWSNKTGDLFYHPKYGILYQVTHYEVDGGPTYHKSDGTQVHEDTFVWQPTLNKNKNKEDIFSKELRKIGIYSGSQQYINPEKKSFPELKGAQLDFAMQYIKDDYPYLKGMPIKVGEARIQDLRTDRVWLDYDSNYKIANIPTIG